MAFTTPRTWTDGELVNAAIMNAHVRDNFSAMGEHLIARKTSDQTNSTTTMAALTTLVLPVAANEVWKFEFMLVADVSAASDWALRPTFPTGGAFSATTNHVNEAGSYSGQQKWYDTTSPGGAVNLAGQTPDIIPVMIWGLYTNGGTAGDVGLDYALAVAAGGSAIVKANSTLWAVQLA